VLVLILWKGNGESGFILRESEPKGKRQPRLENIPMGRNTLKSIAKQKDKGPEVDIKDLLKRERL
jgi:hypothetical protein